jgi:hypothetical protein
MGPTSDIPTWVVLRVGDTECYLIWQSFSNEFVKSIFEKSRGRLLFLSQMNRTREGNGRSQSQSENLTVNKEAAGLSRYGHQLESHGEWKRLIVVSINLLIWDLELDGFDLSSEHGILSVIFPRTSTRTPSPADGVASRLMTWLFTSTSPGFYPWIDFMSQPWAISRT